MKGSPANYAIYRGDVITEIGGVIVENEKQVLELLRQKAGQRVVIKFLSRGAPSQVEIQLNRLQ